jgi:hypothetical protein
MRGVITVVSVVKMEKSSIHNNTIRRIIYNIFSIIFIFFCFYSFLPNNIRFFVCQGNINVLSSRTMAMPR